MLRLLRSTVKKKKKYPINEIVKKEKEICVSFTVKLQTVKVIATMCGKYLAKMEIQYSLRFQASTGDLVPYFLQISEDYYIYKIVTKWNF